MPREIPVTGSIPGFLNLPPEVILKIYSWATLDRYDDADLTRRSPRGALLSHICRSLRSLAISSQGLWDYVPLRLSTPWTELCLARAPTAPLRINLRAYRDNEEHLASNTLVLLHLSRARYLRLCVDFNYNTVNDELTRIFEAFTSFSMPLLEKFDVCCETIDFHDRNHSYLDLPQPLFSGAPPAQLKHLILRQAGTSRSTLPATMPVSAFSTVLRSLDLYNSHLWKDVDEMVQFFQTVPLLEKLVYTLTVFDLHLFDARPSQFHSPRCVRMDHLQTFKTTEGALFSAAMAVFTYLALPPRATIFMHVANDDDWIGEHNTFETYVTLGAQVMHEHFATAIAAGEHYDSLHIDENLLMPQRADDEWASARQLHHLPAPSHLRLRISVSESRDLYAQACMMYLSLPIFTKVKQLSIKDMFDQNIMVALELYRDVRSLTLSGGALASFIVRHALSGFRGSVLFPALEEIHIVDREFPPTAVEDNIFMMNMRAMLEKYISPETDTVAYIDSESCAGAQQAAEWLRKRLGEDRVVVEGQ